MSTPDAAPPQAEPLSLTKEYELLRADFQDLIDQRTAIERKMEGMHGRLNELGRIAALEDFSSQPFPKSIKTDAYLGLNGGFIGEALGLEGKELESFIMRLESLDDISIEILINEDLSFSFGPVTVKPQDEGEIDSPFDESLF